MTDGSSTSGAGDLTPADLGLLAALGRANDRTRSILCTLARRGTWLRHTQPGRAASLLAAVAPWPWYKAGQFLFDLFEWEDFMVDGPPPPLFAGQADVLTAEGLARLLRLAAAELDPGSTGSEDTLTSAGPVGGSSPDPLPPLEPGLHLYQDVVLGAILAASEGASEGRA